MRLFFKYCYLKNNLIHILCSKFLQKKIPYKYDKK